MCMECGGQHFREIDYKGPKCLVYEYSYGD